MNKEKAPGLTPKQHQVFCFIKAERTICEIAEEMGVQPQMVVIHCKKLEGMGLVKRWGNTYKAIKGREQCYTLKTPKGGAVRNDNPNLEKCPDKPLERVYNKGTQRKVRLEHPKQKETLIIVDGKILGSIMPRY